MGTISGGLREDSTDIRLPSRIYFSGIWFDAVSTEIRLGSRRFFLSKVLRDIAVPSPTGAVSIS